MLLSSISLALTRLCPRLGRWSPLALWPDGIATPGMWISPRDLTSQWADYTGTTPVVTPGTVADSSNPVGLALDIRAGAPEVLGPELITNGDFSDGATDWAGWTNIVDGKAVFDGIHGDLTQPSATFVIGQVYLVSWYQSEAYVYYRLGGGNLGYMFGAGQKTVYAIATGTSSFTLAEAGMTPGVGYIDNISVKEFPGNHMLQSTSAARPLLSAYDGQTLGPGDTYNSTGYPVFQLYDGVDDGMATAAFAAGTLIDGMDCMIAVRRDSAASTILAYSTPGDVPFFGAMSPGGSGDCSSGAGTPTVHVDGVQLAGGTAVTRGTLDAALTVGEWHILEFRNLDLSAWLSFDVGAWASGWQFNGLGGDIMLYPSTAPTADKDAARQSLAAYYGVTLPSSSLAP